MLTQDVSLNALDFFNLFDKKRTYTPIECDSKYPESPEEIKMITAYTEAKHKLFKENPHTWKKKEIENLLTQVEKHGKRWKLLSTQYVVNDSKMRSAASLCSKFRNWIKKMSLSSFDRDWSEDEDRRLRIGIMTYGVSSWKKIADLVETKDSIQVHKRWKQICLNMRGHWSEEENEILNKLVKDHEESKLLYNTLKEVGFNWKKIKEKFPKRNIGQIRDYIDKHANVNPFVMHGRWTTEEKARFKQGFDEYGTVWCRVSQVVKSRTQSQCSNHFKYFKNYISDEEYKRLIIDRVNQFKDMKISKQGRVYGKTEIKELSELLEKTKQSGEEGENDFEENFKNDLENKEDEKR
ncbi:962_t:CDS:2 [Diversispora eburnea]|uniref:962_t:CDS:1 n=2 Tax=Diversisporales TaxID=214509 RepID=A0A9N9CPE5_9GLOM|nr:962_t:CDS:2 [Diversispora eburnea]